MTLARLLRISTQRIRSLWRKEQADAELGRELEFHFDLLVAEGIAEGLPPEVARQSARRTLGNIALLEEQCRDQRRLGWLHDLKQDVLYALRMMRKNPSFTAVAAVSLALGIGANTAILGVMDAVTFGHLPFRDVERLVTIRTYSLDNPDQNANVSLPDYFAYKERSRSFESISCSLADQKDLRVVEDGSQPERILGQGFAPGMFETLGALPERGRVFSDADHPNGEPPSVIVIGHRLWQRRFGADPDILGKRVYLTGAPATIIGVMPVDFNFGAINVDYWVPLRLDRNLVPSEARFFIVIARLKPGIVKERARAEINALTAQLAGEFPEREQGWGVSVLSLREGIFGWTKEPLLTLEAAVALVLLIACANVAGLLLARGTARKQEIALRVALGAGRGRIVRQMLTESLLLSLVGCLLGVAVAWVGLRSAVTITPPPSAPRLAEIPMNLQTLLMAALTSLLSGLLFGTGPALATVRQDLAGTLNESTRAVGTAVSRHRGRSLLVTGQIALAFVLLIGAGLLMKSFLRLSGRDLNFDSRGLITFQFRIPPPRYVRLGPAGAGQYGDVNPAAFLKIAQVFSRLRTLPGVESAGGISLPPVNSLILQHRTISTDRGFSAGSAAYFRVTPHFFETMRSPVVRGRDFDDGDTASAPLVAIVNEAGARRFWPGKDPLYQRFTFDSGARPHEVVGVVHDIPTRMRVANVEPIVYVPYLQEPLRTPLAWANSLGQMTFVLRSSGDPFALIPAAREAVAEVDPEIPLANIQTMEQYAGGRMRELGAYVLVLGIFAAVAMLLAALGIYGVMAYAVSQRTHEIGIRMALGARVRDVALLVGRRTLLLIGMGLTLGFAGSLLLARLIASQLWGVAPVDAATFVAVPLALALVAGLACVVPLRRAVSVAPTVALRSE